MGRDKNYSYNANYIVYFSKTHLFRIVDTDFPLPEAGIIGLSFFRQYERYSIIPQYLILDNKKLPLYDIPDGIYLMIIININN